MDKQSDAFRTIGEMAQEIGVKTHILRYWEEQFPMLRPLKRAGGRRHYRTEDVALLHNINQLLNKQGYTIKGAVNILNCDSVPVQTFVANIASAVSTSAVSTSDVSTNIPFSFFGELRVIRDQLTAALEAA